jgi:hypothetical protein
VQKRSEKQNCLCYKQWELRSRVATQHCGKKELEVGGKRVRSLAYLTLAEGL